MSDVGRFSEVWFHAISGELYLVEPGTLDGFMPDHFYCWYPEYNFAAWKKKGTWMKYIGDL